MFRSLHQLFWRANHRRLVRQLAAGMLNLRRLITALAICVQFHVSIVVMPITTATAPAGDLDATTDILRGLHLVEPVSSLAALPAAETLGVPLHLRTAWRHPSPAVSTNTR
jgi:hypothetical protein